jgi:S-adenosylmethionine:diacylglycerol 3-amino-3-carboxypropyl transferase
MSDVGAQTTFWRERLDTRRFRAGFDLLMSRMVLRRVYAAAFLAFLPERFGEIVRRRLERGFAKFPNATNPYVSGLLLGEFSEPRRGAVARVEFVLGDAASYLESCAPGTFGGFTLSNILDGAGASYRERLLQAVRRAGTEDAVVVLRSFAEPAVGMVGNLAESDRAMLWGVVDVRGVGTI